MIKSTTKDITKDESLGLRDIAEDTEGNVYIVVELTNNGIHCVCIHAIGAIFIGSYAYFLDDKRSVLKHYYGEITIKQS